MAAVLIGSVSACNTSKIETTVRTPPADVLEVQVAPLMVKAASINNTNYIGGESFTDNSWMELYKQNNINVDVIYDVSNSDMFYYKLSEAINSGQDYPDILSFDEKTMQMALSQGIITDLLQAYEKYASDELIEYVNSDGGRALQSAIIEGKLYGVPKLRDAYRSTMVMYIRGDWLEKLGLQMPTTMEELSQVAEAFTYNDPDGNGQNDTYGLALNGGDIFSNYGGISAVFEAFGAMPAYTDGRYPFLEKDGELVWGGELTDQVKEALGWLQDMYSKGCISSGFIIKSWQNISADVTMGKCGITFGLPELVTAVAVDAVKFNSEARFIAGVVPTGNASSFVYTTNTPESYYCVSSKCENPEVLIRLMNLSVQKICHPESTQEFDKYYGDGEKYTGLSCSLSAIRPLNANYNTYLLLKEALEKDSEAVLEKDKMFYKQNKRYFSSIKKYISAKKSGSIDWNDKNLTQGINVYSIYGDPQCSYSAIDTLVKNDEFVYCAYNGAMTDSMTKNYQTLHKLLNAEVSKIILGADVNTYDAFLESWKQQGGAQVIAEAKQWYSENSTK